MSKLFTRATVSGTTLTGAALKAAMTSLWDALNSRGFTDSSRTTVTTTSSLLTTQCGLLLVDATAGNITLTLPASGTSTDDAMYMLRRIDSSVNTITVQRAGSDTVEGGTSITLNLDTTTEIQIPAGSSNWRVVGVTGSSRLAGPVFVVGSAVLSAAGAIYTTYSVNAGSSTDFNQTTGIYTAPLPGIYLVTGTVTYEYVSAGLGQFTAQIRKNSSAASTVYGYSETSTNNGVVSVPFSYAVKLAATNTLDMYLSALPGGHQSRVNDLSIVQVR